MLLLVYRRNESCRLVRAPPVHRGHAGVGGAGEPTSKYDLVANLCHDGKAGEGTYKVHIHRKKEELWCGKPCLSDDTVFIPLTCGLAGGLAQNSLTPC